MSDEKKQECSTQPPSPRYSGQTNYYYRSGSLPGRAMATDFPCTWCGGERFPIVFNVQRFTHACSKCGGITRVVVAADFSIDIMPEERSHGG